MILVIFGIALFFLPYYFNYFFRNKKLYPQLGFLKSLLLLILLMYVTSDGARIIFTYLAWGRDGLYLLMIFSWAAHLVVAAAGTGKPEWDSENGASW